MKLSIKFFLILSFCFWVDYFLFDGIWDILILENRLTKNLFLRVTFSIFECLLDKYHFTGLISSSNFLIKKNIDFNFG